MKANCPRLLRCGIETAKSSVAATVGVGAVVGVCVGEGVLVDTAVCVTTIVGMGVWLGWVVAVGAAAKGVGSLVWQAASTAVPNPRINNNFA